MALSYGFALRPADNSAEFSNALHSIIGDGVTQQGGRVGVTVNGFTLTVSTGFAFAAGRYVENDEPYRMTIQPAGNNDDRTDALVARVDYAERKATLEILVGIDPAAIRADPSILRNDDEYSVFLYFIHVKRGATSLAPNDVTDLRDDKALCGRALPLSAISGKVLYVYNFLLSGIDKEVARIVELSDKVCAAADVEISKLDDAIKKAGGTAEIGELITTRKAPAPENEWVLCDGGNVPVVYPALSALLRGTLPDISRFYDRYRTYIYGGTPSGPVPPKPEYGVIGQAVVGLDRAG